jgi:hypothetical protein
VGAEGLGRRGVLGGECPAVGREGWAIPLPREGVGERLEGVGELGGWIWLVAGLAMYCT